MDQQCFQRNTCMLTGHDWNNNWNEKLFWRHIIDTSVFKKKTIIFLYYYRLAYVKSYVMKIFIYRVVLNELRLFQIILKKWTIKYVSKFIFPKRWYFMKYQVGAVLLFRECVKANRQHRSIKIDHLVTISILNVPCYCLIEYAVLLNVFIYVVKCYNSTKIHKIIVPVLEKSVILYL